MDPATAASPSVSPQAAFAHDAFISYSRRDRVFAQRFERALEAYKIAPGLPGAGRYLDVFRDEEDFASADYHRSLDEHLRGSSRLIVLCSPHARASEYVNEEIKRFVELRGANHIIPVLLDGIPNNAARPDQQDARAFPDELCRAIAMPLAASYLGFDPARHKVQRGDFEGAWHMVLAQVVGVTRREIEERDRRRQARRRRIVIGGGAALIAVLTTALVISLSSLDEARTEKARAIAAAEEVRQRLLDTYVEQGRQDLVERGDPVRALPWLSRALEEGSRSPSLRYLLGQAMPSVDAVERTFDHGAAILAAALSADGANVVTAGVTIKVWDRRTGTLLHSWGAELDDPQLGAFSPDHRRLVLAHTDAVLWDVTTGTSIARLTGHWGVIRGAAWSGDGRWLVTISGESAHLWDGRTGAPVREIVGHIEDLTGAVFSSDGKRLVTTSEDSTARIWEVPGGRLLQLLGKEHSGYVVETPVLAPDQKRLFASCSGVPCGWDLTDRTALCVANLQPWGVAVMTATSEGDLVIGSSSGGCDLQSAEGTPETTALVGHQGGITAIAVEARGRRVATASHDMTVRIWDGDERFTLVGHFGPVGGVAFSPDGATLLSFSDDGTAKTWRVGALRAAPWPPARVSPEARANERGSDHGLPAAAGHVLGHSADGTLVLATGPWTAGVGWDEQARVWSTRTHALQSTLAGLKIASNQQPGVAFSPDGRQVVVDAGIWDSATGARLGDLPGVSHLVEATYSPDGARIAGASQDRSVTLWDAKTWALLRRIEVDSSRSDDPTWWDPAVKFSADSLRLVVELPFRPASGGMLRVWDVATGRLLLGGGDGVDHPADLRLPSALAARVRCNVPFRFAADGLEPVPRPPADCRPR